MRAMVLLASLRALAAVLKLFFLGSAPIMFGRKGVKLVALAFPTLGFGLYNAAGWTRPPA